MPDEFIYRVTRRRNRPIYGAWSQIGFQTKVVTKRSLSGMMEAEHENGTWTITHIERAKIGDFEDCTLEFMPELRESRLDSLRVEEQVP